MPHDPAKVEDTRTWLTRAASDLGAGTHDLTVDPPFTGDSVFHAQQAAETSLKGFLAWHDVPFGKTHDIAALSRQCAGVDESIPRVGRAAASLTEYAWKYRYPGEERDPTREEAQAALKLAREVYDAVLERLPGEVRPPERPGTPGSLTTE
jgi:HEPN domain-containing protein